MKRGKVYLNSSFAGILTEDDMGYEFRYDTDYLKSEGRISMGNEGNRQRSDLASHED